ncbi:MAG: hypothetical protein QXQ77_02785 [Candidatus Aenigmatarchaeota archaeon]
MEMVEILGLVVFSSILIIIFYNISIQRFSRLAELSSERTQEARNSVILINLFYTEITGTNRTLAQMVGDMISSGGEMVRYGKGLGVLNVTEVLKYFLDNYLENWQLNLGFEKIGKPIDEKKRVYSLEILIPVSDPEGRFEKVYLYWW